MADLSGETPIEVREVTLPGVGKKYLMPLRAGGNLALIVRPDGGRQMYHFLADEDRPCDVVTIDKEESMQIANLLGGGVVKGPELEELELALGDLEIEWLDLREGDPLVGETLRSVPLRSETGASVIAIMRAGRAIPSPDLDTVFQAGDTVLIIGSKSQCRDAREAILAS